MSGHKFNSETAAAAGRKKKGKKEKRTLEWEAFGKQVLEKGMPRFLEILEHSEDEDFNKAFLQILEYFKPKLSRAENKTEHSGEIDNNITFRIIDGTKPDKETS